MTGIELHSHLIEAGYTIPTIPRYCLPRRRVDRARLNDGVVCYLRKPVDEQHLIQCLRAAIESGEPGEQKFVTPCPAPGKVNRKLAPGAARPEKREYLRQFRSHPGIRSKHQGMAA